jgi:hypothetical protein
MVVHGEGFGMELRFEEDGAQRLRQLAIDDAGCLWAGRPFIDRPVHEALDAMGESGRGAKWRPEDAAYEAFDDLEELGAGPFRDETLLEDGTLWIPQRALGLTMCEGSVCDVVWRRAEDVPRQFAGPFTEAQRAISQRGDLADYLRAQTTNVAKTKPWNPVQWVLMFLLIAVFAYLGREAWRETQRWQTAVTLPAQVVAIEKATSKPWMDHYRVRYTDPMGRTQVSRLERREFYVAPTEVGQEVQVAYASNPPEARGPSYGRDAAFLHYLPQFVGVFIVYWLGMFAAGFIRPKEAAPVDDRPVLPMPPGLT